MSSCRTRSILRFIGNCPRAFRRSRASAGMTPLFLRAATPVSSCLQLPCWTTPRRRRRGKVSPPLTATGPSSSSPRGPHLDTPNRIYSGLFYFRCPEDDSSGGDLQLFRWKDGPVPRIDSYELPLDRVECVATIPYRPNLLVFFPHGIDALHGVSVRQPTPHFRRYVFITAELGEDWLTSPAAEGQLPVDA